MSVQKVDNHLTSIAQGPNMPMTRSAFKETSMLRNPSMIDARADAGRRATRVLVTGATGFVGGRLAAALSGGPREVRCLVRDRASAPARALATEGFELHEGDVLRPSTLRGAGRGVDVAYYLIHSMGRG